MNAAVSFHEAAQSELNEAAGFYNLEYHGLGESFIGEVERGVAQACDYPESCPVIRGRARKMTIRKFPYSVIYSVVGDHVRVLAVAHHRRRPFYWQDRR